MDDQRGSGRNTNVKGRARLLAPARGRFGRSNTDGHTLVTLLTPSALVALSSPATMEVSSFELKADIKQWDENDVHAWLTSLGYPQYGSQIRGASIPHHRLSPPLLTHFVEHGISGDVLCLMDAESLEEIT